MARTRMQKGFFRMIAPYLPRAGQVADAAGAIVEATGITKEYDTGRLTVQALRGVSLRIAPGEVVAIVGPSGCGKTTLLNCLSGLDSIDEGNVFIKGDNLRDLSDNERTAY